MEPEHFQPLVSVIIPTYNRAELLPDAIESVMQQTYPEFEVIVVDDGSTDDTAAIMSQWSDRITYIRREINEGRSAVVNLAVNIAQGNFIAILDSDDVWLPHKLKRQVEVFKHFPECGAVGGGAMYMDLSGRPFGKAMIPSEIIEYKKFAVSMCLPGSHSNEIMRREAFEKVGGLDVALRRAQDYDFWLKLIRQYPIRAVPEVLMYKRAHQGKRPYADIETIVKCRKLIASRIPEPELRRKHLAWMWFQVARKSFASGRVANGSKFVARSFFTYPFLISTKHRRLKRLFWLIEEKVL
ncbi:glycosyltransferase involved in cell wall biosynthesis [Desulfosalsimonas propionicica]|uniref:Glycosyltransferase involved in cell wall biosynthesis n=1 Tax=Desulfosalsimonas propionicica TaxID=332175 RepID=A0A7W0CC53_9BACT|nr:glycosyltransferase [Desulfosalsimonas propionicica]MBA2883005.1 glycosyltransferase involved in cell wall biosynthesis [Desulfosalsimonas propionicica]